MSVQVRLPAALMQFTQGQPSLSVEADTVAAALASLKERHEGLAKHLFDEKGALRNFVNLYLNDEDVRSLQGAATPLKDGDVLIVVPAIACGSDAAGLSPEEVKRYGRHLILPEVGMEGQLKLKRARALIVGAGGLGSPVALYLAAAGVGRIGLVDFDAVDATNLQRQVLYSTSDVGRPKLQAAKERLNALNPGVEVSLHEGRLSAGNALAVLKGYDLVIDGTDNFPTRYLVNDACALLGLPNVYGSIFRFEGQVSVFWAKQGPCYRCLYPEPPPPGLVPSCAEGGVLGVLPGIIGTLQAMEAVKLILGAGEPLIGKLILFDALAAEFRTLSMRKDPNCPLCGSAPTLRSLIDYEAFCAGPRTEAKMNAPIPEITVEELKAKLESKERLVLIDVREQSEYDFGRIPGSKLIPLGQLEGRLKELDPSAPTAVHCRSGGRYARAVKVMREKGFTNVVNVAGGILAWAERIDPSVPAV